MPSNKPKAHCAKVFICKCKSHCTTLNPSTGRYEGERKRVPQSTRDRHTRDDRVLATHKCYTAGSPHRVSHKRTIYTDRMAQFCSDIHYSQYHRLRGIAKLDQSIGTRGWQSLPSPSDQLYNSTCVCKRPPLAGQVHSPSSARTGPAELGTLCFSWGEASQQSFSSYRVSLLFKTFSQESQDLQEQLYQELSCMSREKEIHWVQQWVNLDQGQIIMNTGKSLNSSIIWLSWSNNVIQRSTFIHLVLLIWQQGLHQSHPSLWQGFFLTTESASFTAGRFSRSAESSQGFWGYHQQCSKISFLNLPPILPWYHLSSIYLLHEVPLHLSIQAWGYSCDPLLLHISKDAQECPM